MALGGALREVFAIFGVQVDPEKNLEKGHKEVSGLKEAFEGLVAAAAGSELVHMTREFGEQLGSLASLSAQTGVAAEEIQVLTFAAQENAGSVDEMNASLLNMQKTLRAGKGAAGPQTDALTRLGIAMTDAAGQPRVLNDVLPEVFANFSKLKNPAEEATVATELFGRSGIKMIPTLRLGAEGLEKYRAQLEELGGPVSEETIAKAEGMNNAFVRMDRAFFALKATIGSEVFPQLEKIITGFAHGIARINEFAKGTTLAQSGTLALGAAIAGPLLTALGPLLKPGLKFAAIFLAMDDAIAFLQGKDSVIGAILNGFFGPETTEGVRNWIKGVVEGFAQVWHSGTSIFSAIAQGWDGMITEMGIAIDEFFLKVYAGWNGLVSKLPGVGDALTIDTTKADEELAYFKKRRDDLQRAAYEQQNPEAVARQAANDRIDAEANGAGTGRRELNRDQVRALTRDAFGPAPVRHGVGVSGETEAAAKAAADAHDPKALFAALRAQSAERNAAPPGGYAAAFLPPTTGALPQGAPTKIENHIDARTTVTATTNADPKQIADAVATKQKDSLRNAYESLTARSSATR